MRGVILLILGVCATPLPAWSYSCALSPAGDAVIVKTGNAAARPVICKIYCILDTPEGPATFSCSQEIPAGASSWYVCLHPTGGKAVTVSGGSETCR